MPIMSIAFYMVLIRIAIYRNTPSYLSTTHGISSEAEQRNHGNIINVSVGLF
jgi:hypothetical protein